MITQNDSPALSPPAKMKALQILAKSPLKSEIKPPPPSPRSAPRHAKITGSPRYPANDCRRCPIPKFVFNKSLKIVRKLPVIVTIINASKMSTQCNTLLSTQDNGFCNRFKISRFIKI